ncbi:hypothetical protein QTJ16_000759 [Diplocarpon rosae]|uniref:Uncharacterized protein n=1 Tax=Diplocarpon rosae TaxID=946125 RepID=A0AAD9T706_9HELO|nr:hypothetical protein QTJ16_000759 [Diplocarpon rosae]PBP20871.1 hypothetical protein BUE80_DR008368 [Diplocarpon rosae]
MSSGSDSEDAAMAAAMGFSSFGSKPAAKRRKFNPSTDAFVEGQALEKIDRGGKKGTGSGGNTIPLGKARVLGTRKVVDNEDEITLDEEEEEVEVPNHVEERKVPRPSVERNVGGDSGEDEGPQYMDTSEAAPVEQEDDRDQRPAYEYVNMTREEAHPASVAGDTISDAEKTEMQRRIDAILTNIGTVAPPPGTDAATPYASSVTTRVMPPPQLGTPQRTALVTDAHPAYVQGVPRGRGGRSRGGSEGASSRGRDRQRGQWGQRNEKWYADYYDPNFNANPWEALEKANGLEPVGSWVPYSHNPG